MNTSRIVTLGLLIAIASVLHVVEGWFPLPLPVPGAKLGLANIVSLFVIVRYGWRDAMLVAAIRVLLGTLLGGVFLGPSFAMSLAGAVTSTIIMAYFYSCKRPKFSLIGLSLLGAAFHNLAQITVAAAIVASSNLFWYLPYLILFALPTGFATGLVTGYFLKKMPRFP